MADFKTLSGSRVSFELEVTEADLKKFQKKVLDRFRKEVSVKGFRKGQAPDDVVREAIGPQRLSFEALNEAVDETYRAFIIKHKLSPVASPKVDLSDPQKMPIKIKVEVEVFPEVSLGNYQKIKIEAPKIDVSETEIDDVIETIVMDMNLGKVVDRAVQKKDFVEVDFVGKDKKGEVIPHTDGKNVKIRLGFGRLLEDLEKGICGLKPGEEKTGIKVQFPKNYHNPTVAGMTTQFDVKLHSVHEISVKNLDEALIEKITGKKKPMAEFRDDIRKLITQNKTQAEKQKKIKEYHEKLVKVVKIDLPTSWIQNEVESRIAQLKQSPQYKHDPENFWKQVGKTEEQIKKEFEKRAEHDLKIFLGLSEIIKKENIELDKDEVKKAGEITNKQLAREDQSGKNYEEEFNKTILNLKIDKYLSGLMI